MLINPEMDERSKNVAPVQTSIQFKEIDMVSDGTDSQWSVINYGRHVGQEFVRLQKRVT